MNDKQRSSHRRENVLRAARFGDILPASGPPMMKTKLALIAALLLPVGSSAETQAPREYHLRFFHTHTNQRLDVVYRRGDDYIPDALAKLDDFLRDHRTGDVEHYDPRLFDLLADLM